MTNFSTDAPDESLFNEDFFIDISSIAYSLQRIATALDAIAGLDTND
jgi:hypothetical protein